MRPDSLPRLWRYINLLLTYLLTYIVRYFVEIQELQTELSAIEARGVANLVARCIRRTAILGQRPVGRLKLRYCDHVKSVLR